MTGRAEHFATGCGGRLVRAGLDIVCEGCGASYAGAYAIEPPRDRVVIARGVGPDGRAAVIALAQELGALADPPVIPAEYPSQRGIA